MERPRREVFTICENAPMYIIHILNKRRSLRGATCHIRSDFTLKTNWIKRDWLTEMLCGGWCEVLPQYVMLFFVCGTHAHIYIKPQSRRGVDAAGQQIDFQVNIMQIGSTYIELI